MNQLNFKSCIERIPILNLSRVFAFVWTPRSMYGRYVRFAGCGVQFWDMPRHAICMLQGVRTRSTVPIFTIIINCMYPIQSCVPGLGSIRFYRTVPLRFIFLQPQRRAGRSVTDGRCVGQGWFTDQRELRTAFLSHYIQIISRTLRSAIFAPALLARFFKEENRNCKEKN